MDQMGTFMLYVILLPLHLYTHSQTVVRETTYQVSPEPILWQFHSHGRKIM